MSRTTDFLAFLHEHIGDAYVWGAQGQNLTEMSRDELLSFVERRETSDTNVERALRYISLATKKPLYAFDCSGLIMYYFQQLKGWSSGDESSRGLYSRCTKIERDDLKPGDLVFRHNGERIYHVGVYVGNGDVIEAKGRDDGVVKRDIDASGTSYWNRFGRHPLLQADDEPAEPAKPEPAAKVIALASPYMRGDDIKALQAALSGLGYDCGKADGIAGSNTIKGVRAFVEAHEGV